jgi:hypothetical protein
VTIDSVAGFCFAAARLSALFTQDS